MSNKFSAMLFDCHRVAAGATVFGYASSGNGSVRLQVVVARIFSSMADLPAILL